MRNLMIIDDEAIRRAAFSRLDKLVKKLQRMEEGVLAFYARDQRLFNQWYELTFREQRRRMEGLRDEYLELARFHNLMLALAEMEDLSLPQALRRMREEARVRREGSPAQKATVERAWALREEYVRAESERRERRREKRRAASEEEEGFARTAPRQPEVADLEEMEALATLDDRELEEWLADDDIAFMILGDSLRVARFTGDFALFLRLWDLVHPRSQARFAQDFRRQTGASLADAIAELRAEAAGDGAAPPRRPCARGGRRKNPPRWNRSS